MMSACNGAANCDGHSVCIRTALQLAAMGMVSAYYTLQLAAMGMMSAYYTTASCNGHDVCILHYS